MSNIILFQFESNEIRFVDGLPVANDVAIALGYSDPAATISKKVSEQNKSVAELATPGGIHS
jgi:prophage antirepressor-like protein